MSSSVYLTSEQSKCVNHNLGNVIVSASAGSGKTHVIIERIIKLVGKNGVGVDKLLAVTFTKLAAEEMKEKLKKALIKEYNSTGDIRLKEELSKVATADISTIHSFLSNVLRKYFYVINLDASFEVLDERKSKKLAYLALDELFDELYEEGNEEFFNLLSFYSTKRNDKKLKEIIYNIYNFSRAEESLESLKEKSINSQKSSYTLDELAKETEYPKIINDGIKTVEMLFNLTKKFQDKYKNLKQEENGVDFSDLEFLSIELFKDESVLNEVKLKYDYIFVDEYQDVNAVQEKLIKMLSRDNAFMVGDSKQSIYGFRGCNPEYFIGKYNDYKQGQGGIAINLDKNFRSSKKVLEAVNNVFSRVMTDDFGKIDYINNQMQYGDGYKEYDGNAKIIYIENDVKHEEVESEFSGVYSVIENSNAKHTYNFKGEELAVINLINQLLNKPYFDVKTNSYKRANYSDICVLTRSLKGFGENLVKAMLKSGIPVSSGIKNSIGSYPEIKALYSVIKSITSIQNDIDIATVMVNFYNFTETELATIRCEGERNISFYECIIKAKEGTTKVDLKVKEFLTWFEKIRLLSEYMPASEVLRKVIKDTEFDLKLLSTPFGREKMARVERFISEANFTSKKMNSYEFLDYLDDFMEDITMAETEGENTVKVMTAHASKGLEFPIVIVAGTNKLFSSRDMTQEVYMDREFGIAPKSYNLENMTVSENPNIKRIKEQYKNKRAVEEARLFYVELTRAKCELYIIVDDYDEQKENKDYKIANRQKDFLSSLDMDFDVIKASELYDAFIANEEEIIPVVGKVKNQEITEILKKNISFKYPYIEDTTLPLKTSVSRVNQDDEYYKVTNLFGESDSEKGTAYHRFFEFSSFDASKTEEELNALIEKELISKEHYSLLDANKIKSILSMPIFSNIKGKKLYKEKKFCFVEKGKNLGFNSNENILVQGIIDLIVVEDDGVTLIDYKLSTIESESDIVKKYKSQLSLYKKAIENSLKLKVKKSLIINILQEKIIEIDGI